MLLNDDEIKERIESPINLLNRLRSTLSHATKPAQIPMIPPKAEDVIADLEDKINNTTAKSKAKSILLSAMNELEHRMPEIQKPERLATIVREMGAFINGQEAARGGGSQLAGQIVVYAPQVLSLDNYNIVEVTE